MENFGKGEMCFYHCDINQWFCYIGATNKIIWKAGPFFHQHDIDILDEHRISIFNNNSKDFIDDDVVDANNEVIIYNFKTNKYSSYLKDSLIENDVRTITEGRSEILPNGDLFIEETNYGRTLLQCRRFA